MKALVAFSASSFDTEFPSPFGSAIYDERSGVLVAQAYDTVMKMCDPTNHAEINAICDAAPISDQPGGREAHRREKPVTPRVGPRLERLWL